MPVGSAARCHRGVVACGHMQIEFSSIEQAKAVRDVIQHRVLSFPATELDEISYLELDEVMDLAAFHHRLQALIVKEVEE